MSAEDVKQGTETLQMWTISWESQFSLSMLFPIEAKLNYGIKLPTALSDYLTYIFRDKTTREYRQMIDEKESARQRHELFLELTPCTTGYKSAK